MVLFYVMILTTTEKVGMIQQNYNVIGEVITLYNVCSVHRGMFSTSGDTMSTSGDITSTSGGVQYRGDIMSTSGDVQYIGGIP